MIRVGRTWRWRPITAVLAGLACAAPSRPTPSQARFAWVRYDEPPRGRALTTGTYRNPILPGFYPDPSMVRVGDDVYLINSTFSWFPGIPVWHSRDLVHWRQIGNAIDRADQLDFRTLGMSRGVFAPAISYRRGRFFIVNTCVECGGNFVITARNPAGPWSKPTWLPRVGGIDPSLFFDDDGSAWLVHNDDPPGTPRWAGHHAIWLHRFDPERLATVGEPRVLVDGGVDPASKPVWIEGPHLFKRDGRYYLSAAEGGTSTNHSQVIFRADHLTATFRPAPPGVNPILTQRDLDPARPAPITSTGHADMVEMADGSWWAAFLGTRPYRDGFFNTGRETFLLPVTWRDGWPIILPHGRAVPPTPTRPRAPHSGAAPGDSLPVFDTFDEQRLGPAWLSMRARPAIGINAGDLVLTPGAGIGHHAPAPMFVGQRQRQVSGTVTTALRFAPSDGEAAGLAAVQDDDWFATIALTRAGGRQRIEVRRRAGPDDPASGTLIATAMLSAGTRAVRLAIDTRPDMYRFRYAVGASGWQMLGQVDATLLSTARAGGFTGTVIGPFAQRSPHPARRR